VHKSARDGVGGNPAGLQTFAVSLGADRDWSDQMSSLTLGHRMPLGPEVPDQPPLAKRSRFRPGVALHSPLWSSDDGYHPQTSVLNGRPAPRRCTANHKRPKGRPACSV